MREKIWNEEKKKGRYVQRREQLGIMLTSPRLKRSGSVKSSDGSSNLGVKPAIDVFFFFETWYVG